MVVAGALKEVILQMGKQKDKFGHEPIASDDAFIRILGEEFGEICRCLNQGKDPRDEVIHCTAVCLAFLQGDLHDGRQP